MAMALEKVKRDPGKTRRRILDSGFAQMYRQGYQAMRIDAILKDTKQIHPCAVMLEGEYGYHDVVSGVPIMIGANGCEKIIEVTLNEVEKRMFKNSVESVQGLIDTLNENKFFEEA